MSRTPVNVSNITLNNQSFDDKTLVPGAQVTVYGYSDDMLQGYALGHLLLDPKPNQAALQLFAINPCQLPLPVRLHGGFQGLYTPAEVTDLSPITVGDVVTKLLGRNDARTNFRFRNSGVNPIAIGGPQMTFANAYLILAPSGVLNETFAPNIAWYGICDAGLVGTLVGMAVVT